MIQACHPLVFVADQIPAKPLVCKAQRERFNAWQPFVTATVNPQVACLDETNRDKSQVQEEQN